MANDFYAIANSKSVLFNAVESSTYDIEALNDDTGPRLAAMPEPFHRSAMRLAQVTGAGLRRKADNDVLLAPVRNNVRNLNAGASAPVPKGP